MPQVDALGAILDQGDQFNPNQRFDALSAILDKGSENFDPESATLAGQFDADSATPAPENSATPETDKAVKETFMEGLHPQTIPKDLATTLTPAWQAFGDLQNAYHALHDVATGTLSMQQAADKYFGGDLKELVDIDKKPLKERVRVGLDVLTQLAFLKEGARGLVPRAAPEAYKPQELITSETRFGAEPGTQETVPDLVERGGPEAQPPEAAPKNTGTEAPPPTAEPPEEDLGKSSETDLAAKDRYVKAAARYRLLGGDPEAVYDDMYDQSGQPPTWPEVADAVEGEVKNLTATPDEAMKNYTAAMAEARGMSPEEFEQEFERQQAVRTEKRIAEQFGRPYRAPAQPVGKDIYAKQRSNAQVQTRPITQRVETRPEGAEPKTGDSDNDVGKAQGEGPRGDLPGAQPQPPGERPVAEEPQAENVQQVSEGGIGDYVKGVLKDLPRKKDKLEEFVNEKLKPSIMELASRQRHLHREAAMLAEQPPTRMSEERLRAIDAELQKPAPSGSHEPIPPETPEELGEAIRSERGKPALAGVSERTRALRGDIPQPVAGRAKLRSDVLKQGRADIQSGAITPGQAREAVDHGDATRVRGVVNAHYENLVKAEKAAEMRADQNPNDPNLRADYDAARAATKEWQDNVLNPAAVQWAEQGHSMQGDYPVELDSLAGIKQAAYNKKITIPKEAEPAMKEVARNVRYNDDVADKAFKDTADEVVKTLNPKRIMKGAELTESLHNTLKDITCG